MNWNRELESENSVRVLMIFATGLLAIFLQPLLLCAQTDSPDRTSAPEKYGRLSQLNVVSTLDGEIQPVLFAAPNEAKKQPTPVLIYLHSWSADHKQDNSKWQQQAEQRGWIYIHPNFRGVNNSAKACGSVFARQDILDAMTAVSERFQFDWQRVYLAGTSGGGHMAMLMAAHHPSRFSAVSAWVGISDLPAWHAFHSRNGELKKYARMIEECFGGAPDVDPSRDGEYADRSPICHLHKATQIPLDIAAGVRDGHSGSVPVSHSLLAFNRIAYANGFGAVLPQEIIELLRDRALKRPQLSDLKIDPSLGRAIVLRRMSFRARVTIFDGGHEGLPAPACDWLARQKRLVTNSSAK